MRKLINITPYKEIKGGNESIYDYIDASFVVPQKVILYLQTNKPYMMSPGIYQHPFKDMQLLGPYWNTDDEYYWDRDTWKYGLKYHVTLPQFFIAKVMSDAGTTFLKQFTESNTTWNKALHDLSERPNTICLLSYNDADYKLDDF